MCYYVVNVYNREMQLYEHALVILEQSVRTSLMIQQIVNNVLIYEMD